MVRGLIGTKVAKRLGRGIPVVQLWSVAQLLLLASRHLARLDPHERSRLAALVAAGGGRPSRLGGADAHELRTLVAKLEPRLFAGTAVNRLSPVPVPKRMLYGPRRSPARLASAQDRA